MTGSTRPPRDLPSWLPAAWLAALVLAVDPWAVQSFVVPKWVALASGIPLLTALLAHRGLLRVPLARPWVAVLVVVGLSTAFGTAPLLSTVGAPHRYLGAVTWLLWFGAFVVGASVARARGALADTLCVLVAVNAAIAVAQRNGLDPFGIQSELDRSRAWGTFGSAALLGGFAAVVLPIAAVRIGEDGLRRPTAIAGVLGAAASLVLAGSRGPLVGAVVGLGIVAWRQPERRRMLAAGAVGLVLLALVTPATSERVLGRSDLAVATVEGRVDQWILTLGLLSDDPILGTGPETFRLRFPAVIDDDFERDHGRPDVVHDRAHNLILDTWVTIGVLGLLALGWHVVGVARRAWRDPSPLTAGILGGLGAHLVALQVGFQDAHLDAVVWMVAGLAVGGIAPSGPKDRQEVPPPGARLVVVGLAGLAAVGLGGWAARDVVADHRLQRGSDLLAAEGPARALATLEPAASMAPDRFVYRQVAARAALAAGDTARALRLTDDSLRLAPGDITLLTDRARVLSRAVEEGAADPQLAVGAWAEVIVAQPSSATGHLGHGISLAHAGRLDAARVAWERAADLARDDASPRRNLARLAEMEADTSTAARWWREVLALEPDDPEAIEALAP